MAMGLGDVPGVFLSLVFIVTIGVAAYLILAGLGSSTSDTSATLAIANFTDAMDSIVTYAPTLSLENFESHSEKSRGGIDWCCCLDRYRSGCVQVWQERPLGVT